MLLVQQYLQNKTFGELRKDHGVEVSFSQDGAKMSLNYSQILAKDNDVLAQQCRGLILRLDPSKSVYEFFKKGENYDDFCPGKTVVLARPMDRFFNFGQGAATSIDWNTAKILEKLDGTLCIIWYNSIDNNWNVATRSVPEADIPLFPPIFTFRSLFEKALTETVNLSFSDFTSKLNKNRTYCFELTTCYNQIVVKHNGCKVHLIAVRDLTNHKELSISDVAECAIVPRPKEFNFKNIDDILAYVNAQPPHEHEGVVVLDANFGRIKIKNASYVVYNKLRDELGASHRNCLSLILAGKDDDVLPYMPEEIGKILIDIKEKYSVLVKKYEILYVELLAETKKQIGVMPAFYEKKAFALLLQEKKIWSAPLFEIYNKKSKSFEDFISRKCKDGIWPTSILDSILSEIGY